MKFDYQYRTSDNVKHLGTVCAATREAAFAVLRAQGIKPERVCEAPGFFNKLFGKGKRWIAIGVLCALCLVLGFFYFQTSQTLQTSQTFQTSTVRRQIIGDAAIIEKGIRTGWADVFDLEGDRFLASFAIPGTTPTLRTTTEEKLREALRCSPSPSTFTLDSLEARQILAIVAGMKQELREFLADGGTIEGYGNELVKRQEAELAIRNRTINELDTAKKSGMSAEQIEALWEERNGDLRQMGIKLVPLPE